MARQRDSAICVRHWEWSETSQTVVLFGRALGLVRALAKGSRRDRGPFSGGLEVATLGEAIVIPKPAGQLAILASWDLLDPFAGVRRSLAAIRMAMARCDTIQHIFGEGDAHPEVFDAASEGLAALARGADPTAVGLWSLWRVVCGAGYRIELSADIVTGEELDLDARALGFRPASGGFTEPLDGPGDRWLVRTPTVRRLRELDDEAGLGGLEPRPEVDARGVRLLAAFLTEVLGRPVPALASLADHLAER